MLSPLSSGLRQCVVPLLRRSGITRLVQAANFAKRREIEETILKRVREFAENEGRQPRILIARMGNKEEKDDKHRMIAATAFADLGFDVDVGPLVQSPSQVAQQAADADVHAIGARNLCHEHLTLIPDLFSALTKLERSDISVFITDDIPHQDEERLYKEGVTDIFSPDSKVEERATKILNSIEKAIKSA